MCYNKTKFYIPSKVIMYLFMVNKEENKMFCTKCGSEISEGSAFCPVCGTNLAQQPNNGQFNGAQANYNQQPIGNQNQLGMAWYKFLIYFALFAGAVLNVVSAFIYFSGSQYGGEYQTQLVYAFFDGLQGLDMFMGILVLGAAVLGIVTRFSLSGYKKNAPKLVTALYSYSIVANVIYLIALSAVLGVSFEQIEVGNFVTQIAVSVLMVCLNTVYFKKRAHLFVN